MREMHALADAFGIRLREVPVPSYALDFMRDVLANSTERAENEGAHDTSMGTHNLAMSGDMPIAHPDTRSLLAFLNMALDGNDEEASRRARLLAAHTGHGSSNTYRSCPGIMAACLCIMRPERYGTPEDAAKARGCSARNCYKWMRILRDCMRDEASTVDALVLLQLSATAPSSTSAPTAKR
jgi:hypothetical protein